ncbi:DUF4974 domain-containing protein [Puteibacter caeruleilacunae]|nr:DUF4974 domain-containing protein [Puteibacter caeruleilacunae]
MQKSIFNSDFQKEINEGAKQKGFAEQKKSGNFIAALIVYVLRFLEKKNKDTYFSKSEKDKIRKKILTEYQKESGILQTIWLRRAAMIMVPIVMLGIGYLLNDVKEHFDSRMYAEESSILFSTGKGEQSSVVLPDGTSVKLNYDTDLTYYIDSRDKLRKVELSGEAFFDVVKNEELPFVVKTAKYNVLVTGTSFNVCAYPTDKLFSTSLLEGSVVVSREDEQGPQYKLSPGDKIVFNRGTNKPSFYPVDADHDLAWQAGKYKFEDITLPELFKVIERMHDVKITVVDKTILAEKFSGSVSKREDIHRLLDEVIGLIIPIEYKVKGKEILITRKK